MTASNEINSNANSANRENTKSQVSTPSSHSQLAAIVENAVDAIITIDEAGIVQSANPATTQLFRYTRDELVGHNVKKLMPEPDRSGHDGYLKKYKQTGVGKIIGVGREVTGRRKDGSTFPLHLAVSEFRDGDRRLYTGILRDITKDLENRRIVEEELERLVAERTAQLRQAQADLLSQERLATLGQVAGGIAHEIRNPLNVIKTSSYYLLHANNLSAEKIREHLERIDRQVNLTESVITALSDFARLPDPSFEKVSVASCIHGAANSVSLGDQIELSIDIPAGLPLVLIDTNQMLIVFRNLLRNARDAMPEGGKLTIVASDADDSVAVAVTDTGTGIKADRLRKILEPLYTTKARGMGLGLAISRSIVQKNGGQLSVFSTVGEGSTFVVAMKTAKA